MINNRECISTDHAADRFRSRCRKYAEKYFPESKKINWKNSYEVKNVMNKILSKSEENRSVINKSSYMVYRDEMYGQTEKQLFYCYENLVFVLKEKGNKYIIITCYPENKNLIIKHKKYTKENSQKKKEKLCKMKSIREEEFEMMKELGLL